MNFSKLKLNEGVATSAGTQLSVDAAEKALSNSGTSSTNRYDRNTTVKAGKIRNSAQPTGTMTRGNQAMNSEEHLKELQQLKEYTRSLEAQKVDWRQDLQEKAVDGVEREQHPYVTVMPTGDENLIQAVKQMRGEVKDKKQELTKEEVESLEEAKKKKCKDGYKWDSDKKQCVKKSTSKTTVIVGRGWGGGHHHHHDHEHEGEGAGDTENNTGGDGGMGEMFDMMGDMLLKEKIEKSDRMKKMEAEYAAASKQPSPFDKMNDKQKQQMTKAVKSTRNIN